MSVFLNEIWKFPLHILDAWFLIFGPVTQNFLANTVPLGWQFGGIITTVHNVRPEPLASALRLHSSHTYVSTLQLKDLYVAEFFLIFFNFFFAENRDIQALSFERWCSGIVHFSTTINIVRLEKLDSCK
jgi:hypothetical protein